MLLSPTCLDPPAGRTLAPSNILADDSGRKPEPTDDAIALVRSRAAARLMVHEYTVCRDQHDQLLDESDRIFEECEDLASVIAVVEARVAAAHLVRFQDWSVRRRGSHAQADSGSIVSDVDVAVAPSRKHVDIFEQRVRAQHLADIADTLNTLQATSHRADVHGKDLL